MTTTHPSAALDKTDPGEPASAQVQRPKRAPRPLYLAGAIAACAAAMAGLAALTLVAAIVWIAAPHATVGGGLPGVLRTAIQLWLVGHHVGFDLLGGGSHGAGSRGGASHGAGPFGLLPLGLVLLPGALLWRSGRWVVRTGQVARLRHAGLAALALAVPYGLLTGSLAVASRTGISAPSAVQAALAGFLLALAAGGLGALRALAPWTRLIALLPERARCLVVGATGALAVLAGTGALLTGVSLIVHSGEFRLASDELSPGLAGSALLLLAALAYLPNAVIWAVAYMLGPGFAFGVGTVVAPTGTVLGALPLFPMLAALPAGSPAPRPAAPGLIEPVLLAVPFLAGAFGGILTARTAPTPSLEIAPLWGLASGVLGGTVIGTLAAFSGGPLGTGRLAATGPSGWQVALVAALELGIAAAITAGLTNWLLIRRGSALAAEPALASALEPRPASALQPGPASAADPTCIAEPASFVRLINPADLSGAANSNLSNPSNPTNDPNPLNPTNPTGPADPANVGLTELISLSQTNPANPTNPDDPTQGPASGSAITFDADPEPMLASARSRTVATTNPAGTAGTAGTGPEPPTEPVATAGPEGNGADSGEAGGRVIYLVPRSGEARDAGEPPPSRGDE